MIFVSMFTHLGGNFCVAASDFVSFKSSRQENRLWPTVKCLPYFVEVRMKTSNYRLKSFIFEKLN